MPKLPRAYGKDAGEKLMIPTPFDYVAPKTLEEAVTLLSQTEGALAIAGGQELLTELKLHRLASPLLVDLHRVSGLQGIGRRKGEDALFIGAMTTSNELADHPEVRANAQALAEAAKNMGDAQVRNRATIGGNLAFGSPKADLPAALLALEAVVHIVCSQGLRTVPIDQFFLEPYRTALEAGDIIVAVKLPLAPASSGSAYEKIKIPANGYPLCGVAAVVECAKNGVVAKCRVAVTGVSAHPVRLRAVEKALEGQKPTAKNIVAAAKQAGEGLTCFTDLFGVAEYRANLTCVLSERALTRAVERSASH
jgi:carbon-monoxide dehydrogenase medium subunit